MTDKNSRKYWF